MVVKSGKDPYDPGQQPCAVADIPSDAEWLTGALGMLAALVRVGLESLPTEAFDGLCVSKTAKGQIIALWGVPKGQGGDVYSDGWLLYVSGNDQRQEWCTDGLPWLKSFQDRLERLASSLRSALGGKLPGVPNEYQIIKGILKAFPEGASAEEMRALEAVIEERLHQSENTYYAFFGDGMTPEQVYVPITKEQFQTLKAREEWISVGIWQEPAKSIIHQISEEARQQPEYCLRKITIPNFNYNHVVTIT